MRALLTLDAARIEVPAAWELGRPDGAATAYAVEPEAVEGVFRANVVITREAVPSNDFSAWQNSAEAHLAALDGAQAIDHEKLSVGGHAGGRRVLQHRGPGGEPLTLVQWMVVAEGTGWTVSFTIDTTRYADYYDLAYGIADTFAITHRSNG